MDFVKWFVELAERRPLLGLVAVLSIVIFIVGSYTIELKSELSDTVKQGVAVENKLRAERDSAYRIADGCELKSALNTIKQLDEMNKLMKEEIEKARAENSKLAREVDETASIVKTNTKNITKLKRP